MARWLLSLVLLAVAAEHAAAGSLRPSEPYRLEAKDWPCEQPYQAALPLGQSWTRPELLRDLPDWRGDDELRRLVERLSAFDSPTARSVADIKAYAADLSSTGATRDRELATLYGGLLDEANFYRDIVLTGILQFMAQRQLAADLVAESELAFQEASAADEVARAGLEQRHFWATRALERAQGEARFQCGRLAAIDARFARMAAAVEQSLAR